MAATYLWKKNIVTAGIIVADQAIDLLQPFLRCLTVVEMSSVAPTCNWVTAVEMASVASTSTWVTAVEMASVAPTCTWVTAVEMALVAPHLYLGDCRGNGLGGPYLHLAGCRRVNWNGACWKLADTAGCVARWGDVQVIAKIPTATPIRAGFQKSIQCGIREIAHYKDTGRVKRQNKSYIEAEKDF